MDSRTYWKKRETEQKKHNITEEAAYNKEIARLYQETMTSIQLQIDGFYGRYAAKEGISIAEAKKRASTLDIEAYAAKAKKYVKEKNFSAEANEQMRLYNLTMKVNRLELLKSQIGLELVNNANELQQFYDQKLTDRSIEQFERMSGILGKTVKDNAKTAHAIVNASFHNATWSQRIWTNQAMLKNELDRLLTSGIMTGKNPRELARKLRKTFDVERAKAERLMRTELARVQIASQEQSLKANGFDKYEFIALGDACGTCKGLDGKTFTLKQLEISGNAPPMHPNCRCAIAPATNDPEYEAWLDGFSEHGLSFEAWKERKSSNEHGFADGLKEKRIGTNKVDLEYIKSPEFRRKFNKITDNSAVNDKLRNLATAILTHRNGTDIEDMYVISKNTGDIICKNVKAKKPLEVSLNEKDTETLRENYPNQTIGLHNHPTNVYPTGSDFATAGYRKYSMGIIVTHDGRVFLYKTGDKVFTSGTYDKRVDKYMEKPYNLDIDKAFIKTLETMKEDYGIWWKEI